MVRKSLLIVAATASIIVGAISVHAQESPRPHQAGPTAQMMTPGMQNMHMQMSKMAENCNKMMERMMQPSSPEQKK